MSPSMTSHTHAPHTHTHPSLEALLLIVCVLLSFQVLLFSLPSASE